MIKMEQKKPYEKIIELNGKMLMLQEEIQEEIKDLQPKAVIQLYEMGYSMDKITIILGMGKITIINILHEADVKIRKKGRQKNGN